MRQLLAMALLGCSGPSTEGEPNPSTETWAPQGPVLPTCDVDFEPCEGGAISWGVSLCLDGDERFDVGLTGHFVRRERSGSYANDWTFAASCRCP